MDIAKLEGLFNEYSEFEIVRLLTGNFNVGTFELIKPEIPSDIGQALETSIKHKNHLSLAPVPLGTFLDRMRELEANKGKAYYGKASKPCGYSGKLLTESETLVGTAEELVSFNEFSYFLKLYPWYVMPSNPQFSQYADKYADEQVFLYNEHFDVDVLKKKKDVVKISDKGIHLANKTIIPMILVS